MRVLILLAFLILGGSAAGFAQTEYSSPAQQRAENRRALRDARKSPAPYKDSHLAVSKRELKQGSSPAAAQARQRDKYKFDHTGAAYVREPLRLGLRPAAKKKQPATE